MGELAPLELPEVELLRRERLAARDARSRAEDGWASFVKDPFRAIAQPCSMANTSTKLARG